MDADKATSAADHLSDAEVTLIKTFATHRSYTRDDLIFSEGDEVDSFYFIEDGQVLVYIDKSGQKEEICTLGPGDYFGEMAILRSNRRTASIVAINDVKLLGMDKKDFNRFINSNADTARKIYQIFSKRNEELILKESLIDATGVRANKLHVSIKGDPSIRETALFRGRYESFIDKNLPALAKCIEELLLRRCVYRLFVGFNNGEIRAHSIFNPLREEIHTANKLIDKGYVDRHFPRISYEHKSEMARNLYQHIADSSAFSGLPAYWKNSLNKSCSHWYPLDKEEISNVINRISDLRKVPNYYLRNIGISIIQNAIRMQFNCDGTHIVSTDDYHRFIEENLEEEY
jgi:CRP-like cAMP-binding protein